MLRRVINNSIGVVNLLETWAGHPEVGVAEVDVCACAVPVARQRLGIKRRLNAVLLGHAVQQVPDNQRHQNFKRGRRAAKQCDEAYAGNSFTLKFINIIMH